MVEARRPIKVFYSYAREDREWAKILSFHLGIARRQGRLIEWDNSSIEPGTDWKKEIDRQLATSDIILLLISDHYLALQFLSTVEMTQAIELHERGKAQIIPILLSPASWKETPIGRLRILPANGIPISKWHNKDEAMTSVTKEIIKVVDKIEIER